MSVSEAEVSTIVRALNVSRLGPALSVLVYPALIDGFSTPSHLCFNQPAGQVSSA